MSLKEALIKIQQEKKEKEIVAKIQAMIDEQKRLLGEGLDINKDGDIVNVDCSTILNGYFSDSSRMFCIGDVSEEKRMAFLSLFSRRWMAGRLSVLYGRRRTDGQL